MAFLDVLFPICVSQGTVGGPEWRTVVTGFDSGWETTDSRWPYPRSSWDAAYGVTDTDDLESVLALFMAARGRKNSFRFRDPIDHKSCLKTGTPAYDDQTILAAATAGQAEVQITKTYDYLSQTFERTITKPVSGSVLLGLNGSPISSGFSIDHSTGIITFSPTLSLNDVVTAGYLFDCHCRFANDKMDIGLLNGGDLGSLTIPLVERITA